MLAGYAAKRYEIREAYTKIRLTAKDAKVKIAPSEDGVTALAISEKKRRPYRCVVTDGTLTVEPLKKKWYHALRIGRDRSEISLYLSAAVPEALEVSANVGCVEISSIACCGEIDIVVNTGRLSVVDVSCQSFESRGNTGALSATGLIAEKSISVKRNTGKVLLTDCVSPEILVKTNTGSVGGRLPSGTSFSVRTNTGSVELPKAPIGEAVGGRCEIKTNTGHIRFE